MIDCNSSGTINVTLPTGLDIGTTYLIVRRGSGAVNIKRGGSDTINGGTADAVIANQYGAATLILVTATVWAAVGDL